MPHLLEDDSRQYTAVVNHEGQYSLWPIDTDVPSGWTRHGSAGSRQSILELIETLWTDMRPLSLRQAMGSKER